MLEVRPGLLLGSMGDALAVFTRVPSLVARYQVTHVISLCNEQPEWMEKLAPEEREGSGSERGEDDIEEEEEGESAPAKGNPLIFCLKNCLKTANVSLVRGWGRSEW